MPHIGQLGPEDCDPIARREYDKAMRRAGRIWNIVSIMSQNGAVMRDSMRLYAATMFGDSPLSRTQREMIAVVTSQLNECDY
jgi:alkylhydroperoxidase family enzyme